ncbi:MAG TPA: Smr/MutS family protein [Caulobacteraceae bacterium]|jgi:DNA-nicking Smr family endonuclease
MIRPGPKDARLWAIVAATVRPLPGRAHPHPPADSAPAKASAAPRKSEPAKAPVPTPRRAHPPAPRPPAPPETIEPNRLRLIDRGREALNGTLDLHGLDQDRARAALTRFLMRAFDENHRTVLVITGKGALGDGVLRRRTPEWLAEPPLRGVVAGISEAHRARGGAGALYIALKRNPRRGG